MRKLTMGTIVSIVFVIGCFVYTKWDEKRFVNSLPKPPTVERPIDTISNQDRAVPEISSKNSEFKSETIIEEKTGLVQMASDTDSLPDTDPPPDAESQLGNDWRTDNPLDAPHSTAEPWKQTYPQETEAEASDSGDKGTYLPQDWYKTEAPELYTRYFRAQLIKQFGDRPEVHILADTTLKIRQKIPLTPDEYIADLEAQYALWPDERTLQALERRRKAYAEGDNSLILFKENGK